MTFRQIENRITEDGWKRVRVCGSHYQYKKEGVAKLVVIPNHSCRDISIGVLKNLERITGLSLG
ncbi:MAG: type II toxin-antitoxin system HicA family toxin [Lachnospiraceae bacterium]|nr:type II toxin-antitoxin system HicA family toxin [Lachnospiraceae bacterium]